MNAPSLLLSLLLLLGQDTPVPSVPESPEIVRVLAIEAREIPGAQRYVAHTLAPAKSLLEKVPGNHFTELGFHELTAYYGLAASADLGGGYTLLFQPNGLTEDGEVLFDCWIEVERAAGRVEALRVSGRAARGQGAVFRGLTLPQGEMVVIMNVARAEDPPSSGGEPGSGGEGGEDGSGDGSSGDAGTSGGSGAGDGEAGKEAIVVPELPRRPEPDEEPATPSNAVVVTGGPEDDGATPDLATMEGILRALDEQDLQEQRNRRSRRFDVVIQGDWW